MRGNGPESNNISNFEIPKCDTQDEFNGNITHENILLNINSHRMLNESASQRNFAKHRTDILSSRNTNTPRLILSHRGSTSHAKTKSRLFKIKYDSNKENINKGEEVQTGRAHSGAKKAGKIFNLFFSD